MKIEMLHNTFEYLIRDYQRNVKCTGEEVLLFPLTRFLEQSVRNSLQLTRTAK